ncbi:hypothetical protein JST97_03470 [bacterium]|nr:hypothetical protein [bacterium]
MNSTPLELVVASRNPRLLEGLRSLSALAQMRIVGEGQGAEDMVQLVGLHQPHALIVEDEPGLRESNLIEACRLCRTGLKVVLLEGPAEPGSPPSAIDAFVPKTSSLAALVGTIESLF